MSASGMWSRDGGYVIAEKWVLVWAICAGRVCDTGGEIFSMSGIMHFRGDDSADVNDWGICLVDGYGTRLNFVY